MEEVVSGLQATRVSSLAYRGCLSCDICVNADAPEVLLMQQWNDRTNFRAYLRSDVYLRVLSLLDLAAGTPIVRFYDVLETDSLKYVEEVRGNEAD